MVIALHQNAFGLFRHGLVGVGQCGSSNEFHCWGKTTVELQYSAVIILQVVCTPDREKRCWELGLPTESVIGESKGYRAGVRRNHLGNTAPFTLTGCCTFGTQGQCSRWLTQGSDKPVFVHHLVPVWESRSGSLVQSNHNQIACFGRCTFRATNIDACRRASDVFGRLRRCCQRFDATDEVLLVMWEQADQPVELCQPLLPLAYPKITDIAWYACWRCPD